MSVYELAYGGEGEGGQSFLMGLLDSAALENVAPPSAATTPSVRGGEAGCTGSKRPHNGPQTAPVRSGVSAINANAGGASFDIGVAGSQNARSALSLLPASYRSQVEPALDLAE